jgi:hypothetical protein
LAIFEGTQLIVMFPFAYSPSINAFFFLIKKVEGDGTLVPPTEDEVLQIEQFLDDKIDLPSIDDVGNVEDFFTNDCMLLKEPDFEGDVSIFIQFKLLQCYIISFSVILLHWTVQYLSCDVGMQFSHTKFMFHASHINSTPLTT